MQRNISSRDSVPQKLNTKGKEILKKDSSLFVTTDENTEKFLNTYAKVNFVKADGDLSIMSPNVWPRNILCICTLIIGLEPRSGYYDLYCKVDSRLKSYRTHLKIAIGWDQEESAEILDDAIREHAATTFKKYREILILAEDPSVFLNGKEEVLMVWLNELEEYIEKAETRYMVKILKTEKIAQQMITSKYAFQKNDPVNYPLSENETSMGAAGINELLRACNTKPRELTERLWALDQKSMRLTAIAMAAHPRLGACSPLAMMDADLIQEIVRLCGR